MSKIPATQNENAWIESSKSLPNIGDNVEISEDGITAIGTANFTDDRRCMLAGVAGGHGFFSNPGFATDGSNGEDMNLILDTPQFWRK